LPVRFGWFVQRCQPADGARLLARTPPGFGLRAAPRLQQVRSVHDPRRCRSDLVTAWDSATPDGQDEWLLLVPTAVLVHETYNPGALERDPS
jgi:hypothetical protein